MAFARLLLHDVLLHGSERAEQFVLLSRADLELIQRADQVLYQRIEVGLADAHALVRRLHILPLYLHGPPLAWQIWSTRFILNFASRFGSEAVCLKKPLIRLSAATRPTNSSTTAVIAFLPPSRS